MGHCNLSLFFFEGRKSEISLKNYFEKKFRYTRFSKQAVQQFRYKI